MNELLSDLLNKQTTQRPNAIALIDDVTSLTFQELESRSNSLARHLQQRVRGVGRVAICIDRSIDLVIGIIAAIKSGIEFATFDPRWPVAKIVKACADAEATLIVTAGLDDVAQADGQVDLLNLKSAYNWEGDTTKLESHSKDRLGVVYSSGTTGPSKFIALTATRVLNNLSWLWDSYPFAKDEVVLIHRSPAVAGFILDCLWPLLKGTPSLIVSDRVSLQSGTMIRRCTEYGVTRVWASPLVWELIVTDMERGCHDWSSLKFGRSSGECMPSELMSRWRNVFPKARLQVAYNCSEVGMVAAYDLDGPPFESCRVGKPIRNVRVFITHSELAPIGAAKVGEVCVMAPGMAKRYLNAEISEANFLPGENEGETMYRTGDLGKWRPNGELDIVGRLDDQIKIRGFSINPSDVERALQACAPIQSVAVVPSRRSENVAIVAFYVPKEGRPTPAELRALARNILPDYMVPWRCIAVQDMPRTVTGKVERQVLRQMIESLTTNETVTNDRIPDETATIELLRQWWVEALSLSDIGIDDDFIELGGDSLAGMRIAAKVDATFGVELSVVDLLSGMSIAQLAKEIDARVK